MSLAYSRIDGKKLLDAARKGDVESLRKLLQENPSVVNDTALLSFEEPVLHVATKAEQVNFVVELLKHNHKLARELDRDGFRPLDTATLMGHIDIVRELLRVDPGLYLLKGKDRKTVLHYAATKGRIEVIDDLVSAHPDSITDLTVHGETALHLSVKHYQVDVFKALVKWLEVQEQQPIINWADSQGNTVLHLAALTRQHECIDILLRSSNIRRTVDVNAKNAKGLTASDLFDIVTDNLADIHTREILRLHHAGAPPASSSESSLYQSKIQHTNADSQSVFPKDWFRYFKFQMQRDSPGGTRNALLVVAVLIATVTFEAGVTPPSGVLDAPKNQTSSQNQTGGKQNDTHSFHPVAVSGLAVASAIFGTHATPFLFLFANSLAFTASLSIIIYLTGGFPFRRELLISICAMMFTYGFSVSSVLKRNEKGKEVLGYALLTVAFILPFLLRWLPIWGRRAWKKGKEKFSRQNLLPVESQ